MSNEQPESMTIRIDYGDGTEPEEHVVTAGFFHFHPAVDEEKRIPTVTVVGEDDQASEPDNDGIEDADVVEDDESEHPDVAAGFDPSAHNVQDVKDFVQSHPDEAQAVLDLEVASQNRVTLVSWLESFTNQ